MSNCNPDIGHDWRISPISPNPYCIRCGCVATRKPPLNTEQQAAIDSKHWRDTCEALQAVLSAERSEVELKSIALQTTSARLEEEIKAHQATREKLAEYPTDEEIAAQKKEREEHFALIYLVTLDIKASSKPGDSGERECPKCRKRLRWARASPNGHLHAGCETPKCFRVME